MELKDIKHFKIEELGDILNVKAKLKKKEYQEWFHFCLFCFCLNSKNMSVPFTKLLVTRKRIGFLEEVLSSLLDILC